MQSPMSSWPSSPSSSPLSEVAAEDSDKRAVEELYRALRYGDGGTVAALLTIDLEWWFHGPPGCHHMMRVLTGESTYGDFPFEPRSVTSIGGRVFVEGWEGDNVYWVHVWTLKDGLITQFREYFNTWLTVRDLSPVVFEAGSRGLTLWRSEPGEHRKRSLPGLLLAL